MNSCIFNPSISFIHNSGELNLPQVPYIPPEKQKEYDQLVVDMVIRDSRPVNIVECEGTLWISINSLTNNKNN